MNKPIYNPFDLQGDIFHQIMMYHGAMRMAFAAIPLVPGEETDAYAIVAREVLASLAVVCIERGTRTRESLRNLIFSPVPEMAAALEGKPTQTYFSNPEIASKVHAVLLDHTEWL